MQGRPNTCRLYAIERRAIYYVCQMPAVQFTQKNYAITKHVRFRDDIKMVKIDTRVNGF